MKRIELYHERVFNNADFAKGYHKRNAKSLASMGRQYVRVLKKSGFRAGKILDSGCGFGAVSMEIARAFPETEIIGIDLSETLLDMAREGAKTQGLEGQFKFLNGDVQKLIFDDNSFDLVINTFMIHIVEKPMDMLNEIERVATANARIMVSDLRRMWLGYLLKKFRAPFTLKEALEIIQQSKLRQGMGKNGLFWWDYLIGMGQ